nr:hypothetical protein [Tanacetum cinerariifolium]
MLYDTVESVSDFCKMLNLINYGVSIGFSEYAIVDLVTKVSEDSASLLNLFNKHRRAELDIILIQLVKQWVDAENTFHILSPVALVHQWVDIQYGQTQDSNCKVSTIYSLFNSLETSNQPCSIILEQELNEYCKNKDRNLDLSRAEGIYPGTLPLDRVEVQGMIEKRSKVRKGNSAD